MRLMCGGRGVVLRASCAASLLLASCDYAYRVGARQRFTGPGIVAPAQRTPAAADSSPGPLDAAATGDCLEQALRASPTRRDVERWSVAKNLRSREAGMNFVAIDSSGEGHYAHLLLDGWDGRAPTLEVVFIWHGTARSRPLEEQRRMVAAATRVLQELRARCVPAASGPIECVAEGKGGRAACATRR